MTKKERINNLEIFLFANYSEQMGVERMFMLLEDLQILTLDLRDLHLKSDCKESRILGAGYHSFAKKLFEFLYEGKE